MAIPVTLTVNKAEEDYTFDYSSPDEGVVVYVDDVATIHVPPGLQMLNLELVLGSSVVTAGETAAFIEDPAVWVNDAAEVIGTPSGMSTWRTNPTQLVITVDNVNPGPDPIPVPFFLVVLTTGLAGIRIVGHDPILIEDPPGG